MVRVVIVDTETSGLPPNNATHREIAETDEARLIELAFVCLESSGGSTPRTYNEIVPHATVLPESHPCQWLATATPTTTLPVALANFVSAVCPDDNPINDAVIVGHNIQFDLRVLLAELVRIGAADDLIERIYHRPRLCTMLIAANGGKWPRLTALYERYCGVVPAVAHRAMADVESTAVCLMCLWWLGHYEILEYFGPPPGFGISP